MIALSLSFFSSRKDGVHSPPPFFLIPTPFNVHAHGIYIHIIISRTFLPISRLMNLFLVDLVVFVIKLIHLLLPLLRVSTVLSIYLPIMPSSRVFLFLIFFLCTVVSCRPSPHDYMPLCLRFMPSANDSSFFLLDAMCYIYNIDPFLPHSTCPNRRNTKETRDALH